MIGVDRLLYELPTNVVVAAGAGTGKTHRLAGLYIHLIAGLTDVPHRSGALGPLLPEAIVATTFTREAAAEMRSRIEDRLRALASSSLDALVERDGGEKAWADELRQTCARRSVPHPPRALFARAVEALPRGAITTFHAWAGELVRAYPIEARVPPGFALLEPEDADALIATATQTVANTWLDDGSKSVPMRRLLHSGIALLEKNVRSALMRAAEEGVDLGALLLADGDADIASARNERSGLLRTLARAIELAPRKPRVDPAALLADARSHALSWEREPTAATADAFGVAVKAIFDATPRNSEARAALAESVQRDNGSVYDNAVALLTAPERTSRARELAAHTRSFLADVAASVANQKRRMRALDFGDVLRRARDLLLENPEVQASVVNEVRALLVDEFQDTNALQRDLVYLARQRPEAVAERAPGAPPDPSTLSSTGLFLVGDRKQSIYAFRGADVAVFQQIALEIAGDEARTLLGVETTARSPQTGRVVSLDVNRRSVDTILAFVNALAAVDMRGHSALAPVEQVVFHPELESLRAVRSAEGDGPRVIVPMIDAPQNNSASPDLLAALAVAGEIRALLAERPQLRKRDIAILIRTYAPLSSLEFALALHGIEYAVAAGRGLFATTEAGDVEALARLLLDPRDRHALLAVLRGPLVALTDRALLALARSDGLSLPRDATEASSLDDGERARLGALLEVLEETRRHGARLGAATTLRRALDALGYEQTLALLPSGEARIRDVRRLLEHAERFNTGLAAYADWLRRGREGELDEARGAVFDDEHDAVRILTIHGSKGLEFPVVFALQIDHAGPKSIQGPLLVARGATGLALATRAEVAGTNGLGVGGRALHERALAADRAERQRLSYVALTRARDLLYLVARPGTRIDEHSVARSIGTVLENDPELALQKVLPVVLEPAAPERPSTLSIEPPRFGEGPFVVREAGSVVVTTALAEFATCARRFRLLQVVGLPEHAPRARPLGVASEVEVDELVEEQAPDDEAALPVGPLPTDPRAQGVLAHAALERAPIATATGEGAAAYADAFLRAEGYDPATEVGGRVAARIVRFLRSSYAASLTHPHARVRIERERPFVVSLPSGVGLRGTMDLVVVRTLPDRTRIEVVDYKSGAGGANDVERYELQLRAYAAACARGAVGEINGPIEIVAGIAFLGSASGEPHWLRGDVGHPSSIARIDAVARRLLEARARGEWPGIEPPGCVTIRCGFYPFCHPESP